VTSSWGDEEWTLSPFTGLTRTHWERTADRLLDAVRPFASKRGALIALPGPRPGAHGGMMDALEGFARTFLLAAFRLRGANGAGLGSVAEHYASGVEAGTDPDGRETWPPHGDYGQSIVEAAAIAIALFETRPWIWDAFPSRTRERIVAWLATIQGKRVWSNNWCLFPVVVNAFLKRMGAPHSAPALEQGLDTLDGLYRGDGWYSDGDGNKFDHYNAWGLHFYARYWAVLDGDVSDPTRAARLRARLHEFLAGYRHFVGGNGSPLFQGRSLVYRFAAATPFWIGQLDGCTPVAPGETRRLASGMLRHFFDAGCAEQGRLSLGWHAEFLPMVQRYSGPASPYWASKAFIGLLVPAADAAWTAPEEPLAVERRDFVRAVAAPGFLLSGTADDGIVRAASHRSDGFPASWQRPGNPLYHSLSYSSHTAPDLGDATAPDGRVSILFGDGSLGSRGPFECLALAERFALSRHVTASAGGDTAGVESAAIVHGACELRIQRVLSTAAFVLRIGGWAVAGAAAPESEADGVWAGARTQDGLASVLRGIHGFERAAVHHTSGSNAYGVHSASPLLFSEERDDGGAAAHVFVSVAVLTRTADALRAVPALAQVHVEGRCVTLRLSDGHCFFVQLGEPDDVRVELGGRVVTGRIRYAHVAPDGAAFQL
jgi:hypothetical protein